MKGVSSRKVWNLMIWSSDHKSTTFKLHRFLGLKVGEVWGHGHVICRGLSLLPNILSCECQKQSRPKLSYLIICIFPIKSTYIYLKQIIEDLSLYKWPKLKNISSSPITFIHLWICFKLCSYHMDPISHTKLNAISILSIHSYIFFFCHV